MPSPLTSATTTPLLLPSFLFFFFFFTFSTTAHDEALTAYQVLDQYDFPVGILPKGVLGYELDRTSGKFTAHFNVTCSFSLEGPYQFHYRPTVSGIISRGRIRDLTGDSVKVLLFWLNIDEVVCDGDELDFSVGIASASFSIDNFTECPQCGCGFDCGAGTTTTIFIMFASARCRPFHSVSSS